MKSSDICKDNKHCSGCEACMNVCPHDAISMKPDWRGFLFPHIDQDKCVNCKLCSKRCPGNVKKEQFVFPKAIAFIEKDKEQLFNASSGGAFGVMARYILSKGGIVYGAYMDDNDYSVVYIGIESIDELTKLHGSKYVQTKVGHIYRDVRNKLHENRYVLFCGCPCHIAGLNSFLGSKSFENLYTMDLICHGVPSQPYFKDYVADLLKRKKKQGVDKFRFRWKKEDTRNNVYVGYRNKDYYMTYFLWGKGYRNSCYNCLYAGGKRPADFTIGDYWNNNENKVFNDVTNGSSLILFNTSKALTLRSLFYENGQCAEIKSIKEAIPGIGGQLHHPSKYDIRSTFIYILYRIFGLNGPKALFAFDSFRMKH